MTTAEAAAELGVSTRRIGELFQLGQLDGERRRSGLSPGSLAMRVYVTEESVLRFKAERVNGGARERDSDEVIAQLREEGYITPAEAAPIIGLQPKHVSHAIRLGTMPGRVTKTAWILASDAERIGKERQTRIAALEGTV